MEYIDIYDEDNNLLEKKVEREYAHDNNLWHREILVLIINEKKEILLQQRSYKKRNLKGKWGLLAGHVTSGQNEEETVIREVDEEVGLKIKKQDLKFIKLYKKGEYHNKKFQYIYLIKTNNPISNYKINYSEIRKLKYESIHNIKKRMENNDTSLLFTQNKNFHYKLFNEIQKI